jgi:lysozyme family protein
VGTVSQSVEQMVQQILAREGGFVNDPDDSGGATNFGVTRAALSKWLGRAATVDEVKNLTRKTAEAIFLQDYFLAPRINLLPERTQPFVFDFSVNSGPSRAIKAVQSVCQDAGFDPKGVDGKIGPGTLRAAQDADKAMGAWFLAALVQNREDFYHAIVAAKPSQKKFLKGWLAHRIMPFWPSEVVERMTA